MSVVYKLLNPPVKRLLRSGLHGLMSKNTLLLEFTGRKSGRALSTPISYYLKDGAAHCFTARSYGWWRNLTSGHVAHLTIRGRRIASTPQVETEDQAVIAAELKRFLQAVPRDAKAAGVRLDKQGVPDAEALRRVAPNMVYLKFPLEEGHG